LERHSEHGLARAIIMAAATRGLEPVVARDVRTVPGRGIRGSADGQAVAAGNGALMSELGWSLAPALDEHGRSLEASGYSVIYVGWGERVHAVLSLDDSLLPEARSTIETPNPLATIAQMAAKISELATTFSRACASENTFSTR